VEGMTELNGNTYKVTIIDSHKLKIGDTTKFGRYERNGIMTACKVPKLVEFKSL
jgi:hypothetical protein